MILKEQSGKMVYSDGGTSEENMLKIAQTYSADELTELTETTDSYMVKYTFSKTRHNILSWYPFKPNCSILEVGAGMGANTEMFCNVASKVTSVEMSQSRAAVIRTRFADKKNLTVITDDITTVSDDQKYDYVVVIGVMEYAGIFNAEQEKPQVFFLQSLRKFLKPDGILLLAIENRFGLRYWLGAAEDHIEKPFVGIAGFETRGTPRTFSKSELKNLFSEAGFAAQRYYNTLPDYKYPSLIFSEDFNCPADDIRNVFFTYGRNTALIADERDLYKNILENDMMNVMANSYLVEVGQSEIPKNYVKFAAFHPFPIEKHRICTMISSQNTVIKQPATDDKTHIRAIASNAEKLTERGIRHLSFKFSNDKIITNFVDWPKAATVFREALICGNRDSANEIIDNLKQALLASSEQTVNISEIISNCAHYCKDNDYGIILADGYMDMVLNNAFWHGGELVFFDQEWCFEKLPIQFLLYYAIKTACDRISDESAIDTKQLLEHAGVDCANIALWEEVEPALWNQVVRFPKEFYMGDPCPYSENLTLKFQNELLISNRDSAMAERDYAIAEHASVLASRSYRIARKMSAFSSKVMPSGSKRRFFAKYAYKFIKNPIRGVRQLTPRRVARLFKVIGEEGINGAARRIDDKFVKLNAAFAPEILPFVEADNIDGFDVLTFIEEQNPTVSIIIPCYNQFGYTYNCLKSILKNSKNVSYEVILADDNSADLTIEISRVVKNIHIIRNEKNLQFLLNCNNAAKSAHGKYILFLNNDTQVQPNWLNPLVDLIENDSKIGLVGSKLVYPNGTLQEAGGILWKDGSAWNYGNGKDSTASEFNYVKDADYISGASVMIKKDLWQQIGGFDARFCPAYCEDSDLAFSVRSLGYRTVYQPMSAVVHFEGMSHGTDIKSGLKKYQDENMKKMHEKWKKVLKSEHFENGTQLFSARDRSRNKKTLLMVDHYVPTFDRDAGSRTVFQYLKLFVSQGYNVKFIGDNFYQSEPYTTMLQQTGIEVLYGKYYADNWKNWIIKNGKYFDYVWLNRPHISVKYIDFIKKHSKAKVLYYGHDLHYLRNMREYELSGDKKLLAESEKMKLLELGIMRKSDMVCYPSDVEIQEITKTNSAVKGRAIPGYIYDYAPTNYNADRNGLLFVGGFAHSPNVDALLWFAKEVFPKIQRELNGIKLNIVGSNPGKNIESLVSESITLLPNASDEELSNLYTATRMVVVPLRYGAGVKGKVVEAMHKGCAVITTAIGAEGLSGVENSLIIADGAEVFAEKLVAAYQDDNTLKTLTENAVKYVNDSFSQQSAINSLKDFFEFGDKR